MLRKNLFLSFLTNSPPCDFFYFNIRFIFIFKSFQGLVVLPHSQIKYLFFGKNSYIKYQQLEQQASSLSHPIVFLATGKQLPDACELFLLNIASFPLDPLHFLFNTSSGKPPEQRWKIKHMHSYIAQTQYGPCTWINLCNHIQY